MNNNTNKHYNGFDRSVCFTFFGSYLPHIETVEELLGTESAYALVMSMIRYALYEEKPEDAETLKLLKKHMGSIDANQAKRATYFK